MYAYHFSSYHIVCCSLVHVYYGSFVNELPLFSLYSCFLFTGIFLIFFFFWGGGGGGGKPQEKVHMYYLRFCFSLFCFLFSVYIVSVFFAFFFSVYIVQCILSFSGDYFLSLSSFLSFFFLLLYASCCFVANLLFRGNNIGDWRRPFLYFLLFSQSLMIKSVKLLKACTPILLYPCA